LYIHEALRIKSGLKSAHIGQSKITCASSSITVLQKADIRLEYRLGQGSSRKHRGQPAEVIVVEGRTSGIDSRQQTSTNLFSKRFIYFSKYETSKSPRTISILKFQYYIHCIYNIYKKQTIKLKCSQCPSCLPEPEHRHTVMSYVTSHKSSLYLLSTTVSYEHDDRRNMTEIMLKRR